MSELLVERTLEAESFDELFELDIDAELGSFLGATALSMEDVQAFTGSVLPPQSGVAPTFNSFVDVPERAFSSSLIATKSM